MSSAYCLTSIVHYLLSIVLRLLSIVLRLIFSKQKRLTVWQAFSVYFYKIQSTDTTTTLLGRWWWCALLVLFVLIVELQRKQEEFNNQTSFFETYLLPNLWEKPKPMTDWFWIGSTTSPTVLRLSMAELYLSMPFLSWCCDSISKVMFAPIDPRNKAQKVLGSTTLPLLELVAK